MTFFTITQHIFFTQEITEMIVSWMKTACVAIKKGDEIVSSPFYLVLAT